MENLAEISKPQVPSNERWLHVTMGEIAFLTLKPQ